MIAAAWAYSGFFTYLSSESWFAQKVDVSAQSGVDGHIIIPFGVKKRGDINHEVGNDLPPLGFS
jgi:hypothetical protein